MGASWKKTSKDKRLPTKPPPLFNGVVESSAAGRVGENANKKSKIFSSNSSNSCFSRLPLADKKVTLASTDLAASVDELSTFTLLFENTVFEGGGVKGIAYVGAVKCLNDVGIRLKRFAGSSIGATVAGFLSVGYTADEMVALYLQDLSVFIRVLDKVCHRICMVRDVMVTDVIVRDVMVGDVMVRDVMVNDVMAGHVMVRNVMVGDVMVRDVIVNDVMAGDVMVRNVMVKHVMVRDVMVRDVIVRDVMVKHVMVRDIMVRDVKVGDVMLAMIGHTSTIPASIHGVTHVTLISR
ncbi:hypothetical protein EB796_015405 [Bugula neritina]|uniref:PNPLA domain-containing protein n=1 Tax=Bugula neritina TaxID=10212 RepID=A0A7J7JIY9_BUGNE|nr:hypothetical protein EB796_015405 [Bugula neritina]